MQLLSKMIMRENQTLTFDQVYSLFQRELPHIRYINTKENTYRTISVLEYRVYKGKKKFVFVVDWLGEIVTKEDEDKFYLSGDEIWLNDTHLFKLYNKAASNKELLRLIYSEAI